MINTIVTYILAEISKLKRIKRINWDLGKMPVHDKIYQKQTIRTFKLYMTWLEYIEMLT